MTNHRTGQDTTRAAERAERDISEERKAGRAAFADLLHAFFKSNKARNVAFLTRWAGVWSVSEGKVRQWASALHTHSTITCGDVQALPAKDRAALLRYWLEETERELAPIAPLVDPRFVALSAAMNAGDVSAEARSIMADGHADEGELVRFEAKCEEGEQLFCKAKLATRAALRLLRGER